MKEKMKISPGSHNMKGEEKSLYEEALKVYEIPPQWVFAARFDPVRDAMVILTNGGKKVIHKKGEPAKFKLTYEQISGFLPKKEMYWSDKFSCRISIDELKKV